MSIDLQSDHLGNKMQHLGWKFLEIIPKDTSTLDTTTNWHSDYILFVASSFIHFVCYLTEFLIRMSSFIKQLNLSLEILRLYSFYQLSNRFQVFTRAQSGFHRRLQSFDGNVWRTAKKGTAIEFEGVIDTQRRSWNRLFENEVCDNAKRKQASCPSF